VAILVSDRYEVFGRIGLLVARILFASIVLAAPLAAPAAGDPSLEDAVKATYIYKFAPFIDWPGTSRGTETFTICVIDTDSVTALLPQATAGQNIDNKPIVIQPVTTDDVPASCRILYVASPTAHAPALEAARTEHILTITSGGSANEHGIIVLTVVEHHVRFDVDLELAAEAGLSISSKLLSLARAVTSSHAGGKPGG
jgi:hypothetical protein